MIRIRTGIIGCGDIGFLFDYGKKTKGAYTHFKAFKDNNNFEITAVAEIKKGTRDIISDNFKIPAYKDYRKMLEENIFDVIVIATNDESHHEILKEVIKYKPRLVFSEKPLALNLADVKEIIRLYNRSGILLQVNYTRRFLKEFYEIEKIIKEKKIGRLESATFYYSRGLIHNASHYLDLLEWYFPGVEKKLVKISSKKGLLSTDDTISFDMKYNNGPEIRFIGLNPTKLSFAEIDFIGTEGRLKINYRNETERYKVVENKIYKGYKVYKMTDCRAIDFSKALPEAAENILRVIKGKDKMKSPAENSLKIFKLIESIKEKPQCLN